ncbi:MAG: hypothetical protein MHM6MM_003384 [Cercozoa sp. M6MM]
MSSARVLALYRQTLREARKFASPNLRDYALRTTKLRYHKNASVTDATALQGLLQRAQTELDSLRRQVAVDCLYRPDVRSITEVPH